LTEDKQPHPRARALRLGYALMAAACALAAALVGVISGSLGALLVTLGLACETMVFVAVLLQDGESLPRHARIPRGELRALYLLGLLAALGGLAVLIDVAASGRAANGAIAGVAVALAVAAGAAAVRCLIRG
jgi:hypothetical protein